MRTPLLAAGLLFTLAGARAAHADQCQVLDKDQATWAVKLIKASGSVVHWCETCKDSVGASAPVKATNVRAVVWPGDKTKKSMEVYLTDRTVDTAYVYVQTGANTFANLAHLVGCPTSDVKPFTAAGTGTGKKPPVPGTQMPGPTTRFDHMQPKTGSATPPPPPPPPMKPKTGATVAPPPPPPPAPPIKK